MQKTKWLRMRFVGVFGLLILLRIVYPSLYFGHLGCVTGSLWSKEFFPEDDRFACYESHRLSIAKPDLLADATGFCFTPVTNGSLRCRNFTLKDEVGAGVPILTSHNVIIYKGGILHHGETYA